MYSVDGVVLEISEAGDLSGQRPPDVIQLLFRHLERFQRLFAHNALPPRVAPDLQVLDVVLADDEHVAGLRIVHEEAVAVSEVSTREGEEDPVRLVLDKVVEGSIDE